MQTATLERANWGLIAFGIGAVALLAAAIMVSGLMAGDPEPEKSIGTLMGEIARDMRAAATGAEPSVAPEPAAPSLFDFNSVLWFAAPILGMVAVILGGISLFKHEPSNLAKLAIGMGIGAVLMQYVFWLALLICGAMILVAIAGNIEEILGG